MSRLVIYGCGGFGREMLTIARRETRTIVFADDIALEPVLGVDVIRPDDIRPADEVVIAIADSEIRRRIAERPYRRSPDRPYRHHRSRRRDRRGCHFL